MSVHVVNDSGMKFAWLAGRVPPRPLTGTFIVKTTLEISRGSLRRSFLQTISSIRTVKKDSTTILLPGRSTPATLPCSNPARRFF
jgi:hypothetical protein